MYVLLHAVAAEMGVHLRSLVLHTVIVTALTITYQRISVDQMKLALNLVSGWVVGVVYCLARWAGLRSLLVVVRAMSAICAQSATGHWKRTQCCSQRTRRTLLRRATSRQRSPWKVCHRVASLLRRRVLLTSCLCWRVRRHGRCHPYVDKVVSCKRTKQVFVWNP